MYVTTTRRLIDTARAVKANPRIKIKTGMWEHSDWTAADFRRWFYAKLDEKINRNLPQTGRKQTEDYQIDQKFDSYAIKNYYGKHIRHSGSRNLLRTPELRRLYPQVNCQSAEF